MPGPMHSQNRARPQNVGKTFRRILTYLAPHKLQMLIIVMAIMFSSFAGVAGTYFLKPLINNYIVPFIGHESPDLSGFIRMLSLMGAIYIVGVLCSLLYSRLMVNVATDALKNIRVEIFTKMQSLPIRYFDTHTHGELMSRYTNDTDTVREMLGMALPQIINSGLSVIGVFIAMLILSPLLTLLIILMLAIMLFIIATIGKRSTFYFGRQQKAIGEVNGYIEEMIEGQKVVKIFNHEEAAKDDFNVLNDRLCQAATSANSYANILMPIMGNLSYVNYAITASIGAMLVISGRLDLGTIASFLQYTRAFSMPITHMSQQFNSILVALAGAERIFELIDEEPEADNGNITLVPVSKDEYGEIQEAADYNGMWAWKEIKDGAVNYTELKGNVRFDNVTFSYDGKKDVLKNVSLFAKPGQKLAFVGSTGAGKTTITNLINRFYDVPDGKIFYDGIYINRIKKADLRRSLGMVLQDTHLFTGTVRDNIRYGKLNATDEEIVAAAKLANAHSFIKHLPQGYDTLLTSDGANLSQGQRQLLAIALTAVANPPVLILDEATSSIDTRTEALIEKGMDKLMAGRTVFVIAHRLSTVRNSNAILVLEDGQIIERGDHDDLLGQKGKYYQLYTGTFELS